MTFLGFLGNKFNSAYAISLMAKIIDQKSDKKYFKLFN